MTEELDRWFPKLGQCGLCSFGDQRHRVLDAIVEHASVGETPQDIARELDLPVEAVRVAIAEWVP